VHGSGVVPLSLPDGIAGDPVINLVRRGAMRRVQMTTFLVAVAAMLGACGGAAGEPGGGSVAPATVSAPPAPRLAGSGSNELTVCVVQEGDLQLVRARYDTRTGDTVVDGRPFASVYPDTAGYAGAAEWYVNNEPLSLNGRRHVKYGLPRVLGTFELTRVGEYRGVPLFAEKGAETTSDITYVPVRPGCEFQPYDGHANVGAVRG
jgi:hypothetical protein